MEDSVEIQNQREDKVTLKFIATSDIHGAIFPYDFIEDMIISNSLSQIYAYVKEQRGVQNQEVILLDNGDMLQGQPVVYYSNYVMTDQPHICSEVMNFMEYDAATVGNHDIEAGHSVYDKLKKEFNFPWMAANAVDKITQEPYFKPYTIINRRGIKIAVLGLITPAIPNWLPEKIWEGIDFLDMVESAKHWVNIIKEKESPDVLIGLFHSGVDFTYNNQSEESFKNENAAKLVAKNVPGFDVVFAGHDHQEYNNIVENIAGKKVLILDPKSNAKMVSVSTITLEWDNNRKKYRKDLTGLTLEMNFCEPDYDFVKKFEHYKREVKKYVSQPIGFFNKTISIREALFGNTAFVDLVHKIQLEETGADISFASPLSFDTKINKGKVFIRDMFKIYKFENILYKMRLTGKEIHDYLEYSYGIWFNEMRSMDDYLLNFDRDYRGNLVLRGKFYNYSSASGIKYTVDLTKKIGERILITELFDGRPFDFKADYIVAINSYRANGGGGHLKDGAKILPADLPSRVLSKSEKDLRYIIMKWFENNQIVTPQSFGNWKAIPDAWWRRGKRKSMNVLYES